MNITLIGGGTKRPAIETTLESIGTEHMNVLLIPTACSTEASYTRKVSNTQRFFETFGVNVEILHDFTETPEPSKIVEKIGNAALLHTLGGNTPFMLRKFNTWETAPGLTLSDTLRDEIRNGKPHSGISAGAGYVFESFHSNPSSNGATENWDFEFLDGLHILKGVSTMHAESHDMTPHGPRDDSRLEHMFAHTPPRYGHALAIENGASVHFHDTRPQIIRALPEANVHIAQRDSTHILRPHIVEDPSELNVFLQA